MNRKTWIYSAGGLALLVLLAAWAFAPRAIEVELAPVTQGRFELTVEEEGRTRLAERYVVSAPLAGSLSRISLREGDAVQEKATLALLTPSLPALLDERSEAGLRARLDAAQAGAEAAAARLGRARVALEQAQSEARRSEQLAQQGFIAPTRLESDRLARQAALKEVEAASAERHVATHEIEQARAALSLLRQGASSAGARGFAIRSPIAGQVLRVLQPSEAIVVPGTPLLEIGDTARLEILAELLTTDALSARPGSLVRVERWGGPGMLLGHVRRVEPSAFTKVSALGVEEQRVRVLIDIDSPREQWQDLGDGFRVGVRIVTMAQDKVLQVPVSAVFPLPATDERAAPAHAVFVADGGRARLTPVMLAARNGSSAWLREGVAAGAKVIVYPGAAVVDGARIRARKV